MKFVVYPSREGIRRRRVWRWRLVAGNGETVASGEAYTREVDATRAIRAITNALTGTDAVLIEYA